MLIMLISYSSDFYRFLQFLGEIPNLSTKIRYNVGKNHPRQLLFRFVKILRRKHIVKISSIKAVLAMADGVVENH